MVQIVTPAPKSPSFLHSLVGGTLEALPEYAEKKEMAKRLQQENEALQKAGFGELAGLSPELKKVALGEKLKQQGKESIFSKKQDYLSQLLGGQQSNLEPAESTGQGGFNPKNISDADIAQAVAIDPQLGNALQRMKDVALREETEERKERTSKEKNYFKINEPKVIQLADTANKLQTEQMRYERLGELFSDPQKFPSAFTASLFSKEGQINDIVYSQLTPEAQEAIKLIIDSTSNIKDTYGARVTNFDLQTYLKKLPSLLNSPEGKERVLRDLMIMNELNQMHANGIMEIFDEAGGTDKIPYSTAERKYKQKYGPIEDQLRKKFITPEKKLFKSLPDAQQYLGKKIRDSETGEVLISDGYEWKPYRG